MKCLTVFEAGGTWFGSETNWKRSGSGTYRETVPIVVPQTRDEIETMAKEFGYSIEWRGTPPPTKVMTPKTIPTQETAAGLT